MSNGHGNSRRQAYGRRMKDLRNRRTDDLEVDLEGPGGWNRGSAWDTDQSLPRAPLNSEAATSSARTR